MKHSNPHNKLKGNRYVHLTTLTKFTFYKTGNISRERDITYQKENIFSDLNNIFSHCSLCLFTLFCVKASAFQFNKILK